MPETPFEDSPFDALSTIVPIAAVLIALLIAATVAVNFAKVRRAGHSPLTLDSDLAVRALDSELLAPSRSIEDRLRELDDLHARGVITTEERDRARAEVLSSG